MISLEFLVWLSGYLSGVGTVVLFVRGEKKKFMKAIFSEECTNVCCEDDFYRETLAEKQP